MSASSTIEVAEGYQSMESSPVLAPTLALAAGPESSVQPYVQQRAPDLHEAWAGNGLAVYNQESGQYITDVEVCTARFKKVMALYTEKTTNSVAKRFDITACHTWEEVQVTASQAVEAYHTKEKGFKGFLKKAGRKFGKASPAHQGWIQTLPAGDYSAILCGALTLVFGAAARMSEVRKKILDALDCIPDTLELPEAYLMIYKDDSAVARKASELYMAMLEMVEGMLDWLDHKAYKEVAKVFVTQNYYGTPIEAKIDAVQTKATAFTKQVDVCLHLRMGETNNLARVNHLRTGVMLDNMHAAEEYARDSAHALNALTDYAKDNSQALNTLSSMLSAQFNDLLKQAEWHMKLVRDMTARAAIQAPPQPLITISQLSQLLQIQPQQAPQDSDYATRRGSFLKPSQQQRAAWLMSNSRFQSWFQSSQSDILVVDGMSDLVPISPLSYFCAMLSTELHKIPNVIPLTFYCGMHAQYTDNLSDASALMRCLLAQLLSNSAYHNQQINLSFISADAILGVQTHRLDYLCELFRRLVLALAQSPTTATTSTAIFCLIDGVSWFETETRRDTLWFTMQKLRDLVFECNTGGHVVFKLLVTSPKASLHVKHVFPREKQMVMPSETLGSGLPFGQQQMAAQQQRLMGSASSSGSSGGFGLGDSGYAFGTPSREGSGVILGGGLGVDMGSAAGGSRPGSGLGWS